MWKRMEYEVICNKQQNTPIKYNYMDGIIRVYKFPNLYNQFMNPKLNIYIAHSDAWTSVSVPGA